MSWRDSASSGPEGHGGNRVRGRQPLPPIRTVLGDQLALPTILSSHSPHSASSRGSVYASSWEPRDRSEAQKSNSTPSSGGKSGESQKQPPSSTSGTSATPPTREFSPPPPHVEDSSFAPTTASTHSLPPSPSPFVPDLSPLQNGPAGAAHDDAAPSRLPPWVHPVPPNSAPACSYNVLRPSPTGGFITAPSVSRARPKHRTDPSSTAPRVTSAPGSSARTGEVVNVRRHVCPMCQKRFNRPSSLRTHQSVHTGSRPFPCTYPGCRKIFSVASNMRRHLRSHGAGGETGARDPAGATELEPGHDSLPSGSSEGEFEMELEEEPHASTPASAPPAPLPAAVPSGLADPGVYFEWTTTRPATEDASTSHEPNVTDTYPSNDTTRHQ